MNSQTWYALGSGLNNEVFALATDGINLYAGGLFTDAGGNPDADYIARWDGHEWHSLGSGTNSIVWEITVDRNIIYAGGDFTEPHKGIMKWDGNQWHSLGVGFNERVFAIAVEGEDVYAGGDFPDHISKWNGINWSTLGEGLENIVSDIIVHQGDVYVGGGDVYEGGLLNGNYILRWDGNGWHQFGAEFDNVVTSLHIHNDQLYAGGLFNGHVAVWNGFQWGYFDNGPLLTWGEIMDVVVAGGETIFAAAFDDGLLKWNGTSWQHLHNFGPKKLNTGWSLAQMNNDIFVGGGFFLGEPGTYNIARWSDPAVTSSKDYRSLSIIIYPNPAHEKILIAYGNESNSLPCNLTITTTEGKVMLKKFTASPEIDISLLSPGMYYLQIQSKEFIGVAKFLKI